MLLCPRVSACVYCVSVAAHPHVALMQTCRGGADLCGPPCCEGLGQPAMDGGGAGWQPELDDHVLREEGKGKSRKDSERDEHTSHEGRQEILEGGGGILSFLKDAFALLEGALRGHSRSRQPRAVACPPSPP